MDGLLVIDKPAGPTSHDVVNRMRRVLGERRIGHAGTLDPGATGILVLLVGRATRLARFLSGSDKTYDAVVRLGQRTDSGDADGMPVGPPYPGSLPSPSDIERALETFRGSFLQRPPAFSAKHVEGTRSHRIARSARRTGTAIAEESRPDPVAVSAHEITVLAIDGRDVSLRVACSAGFYVRSLADDLGERLGTGGHLKSLRRTRSGDFGLDRALPLDEARSETGRAAAAIRPMAEAVPGLPVVTLTREGVRRVLHGRDLAPSEIASRGGQVGQMGQVGGVGQVGQVSQVGRVRQVDRAGEVDSGGYVRLLDPAGELIAIGEPARTPGFLHPLVVLG
ncbi:MAG TPA: tRNA pseudouridine(55) synthase TruB [Vicinamibacterales bacterium]